jgi:integrase
MGCIYQQGRIWWIKYYRGEKPFYESTRSDKKEIAKKLLKRREGEIAKGEIPGIYFDKVFFDELAADYLTDYRVNSKKTLDDAQHNVERLKKSFGGIRAPEITTARIKEFIEDRMKDGVANATINRELAALKRMLNLAAQSTPPKVAQVPYIPILEEKNVRKGFFEHEEFLALREALPDYLKPVVTFAYHTGWRREEILGLTWDRVDLKAGTVHLAPGMTKNREPGPFT